MRFSQRHRWGACFVLLICLVRHAGAVPLALSEQDHTWDLGPYTSYLADPEGSLTLEDLERPAMAERFVNLTTRDVNFALTESAYWFRFTVRNPAPATRAVYVDLDNARLGLVEFFYRDDAGAVHVQRTGTRAPFSEHEVQANQPTCRLALKPDEERTVYVRVANRGWLLFRMTLWDYQAFDRHSSALELKLGLLYGALLVMLVQSVIVYARLRDRSFLYPILFTFFCLLFELAFHGTAHRYLWPGSTWWADRSIMFFIGFTMASLFAFARVFLNTRLVAPRWDKVLVVLIVMSLCVPLGKFGNSVWVNGAAHVTGGVGTAATLLTALWCWHKGHRPALMFLAAWGLMLAGAVMIHLVGLGVLPRNFVTEDTLHAGMAIAPMLFTLALVERVRRLEMEYRSNLEQRVAERTGELRAALDNVKTLRGLVPICANCKKVRDDTGYWNSIEKYIHEHSEANITHGLCPECLRKLYGDDLSDRIQQMLQ